jgi:hypothetical protein
MKATGGAMYASPVWTAHIRRSRIQQLPLSLFLTIAVSIAGLTVYAIEALYVPGFMTFPYF